MIPSGFRVNYQSTPGSSGDVYSTSSMSSKKTHLVPFPLESDKVDPQSLFLPLGDVVGKDELDRRDPRKLARSQRVLDGFPLSYQFDDLFSGPAFDRGEIKARLVHVLGWKLSVRLLLGVSEVLYTDEMA